MSKVSYGKDWSYADTRLRRSLVKTKDGEILLVESVGPYGRVLGSLLLAGSLWEGKLKDLDLSPFKLGFVNYGRGVQMLTRTPARQWRQGLSQNSFRVDGIYRSPNEKRFKEAFTGRYPNLSNCVEEIVNEEADERAFSRNFSVRRALGSLKLAYRKLEVGHVEVGGDKMPRTILDKDKEYLIETLEGEKNV